MKSGLDIGLVDYDHIEPQGGVYGIVDKVESHLILGRVEYTAFDIHSHVV